MKLKGRITAFYSRRDKYGNCYWAFSFIDYETGAVVRGRITGDESNLNAVRLGWSKPNEWDRSIEFCTVEKKIREFNEMTKNWPHFGCHPEDIRNKIKTALKEIKKATPDLASKTE